MNINWDALQKALGGWSAVEDYHKQNNRPASIGGEGVRSTANSARESAKAIAQGQTGEHIPSYTTAEESAKTLGNIDPKTDIYAQRADAQVRGQGIKRQISNAHTNNRKVNSLGRNSKIGTGAVLLADAAARGIPLVTGIAKDVASGTPFDKAYIDGTMAYTAGLTGGTVDENYNYQAGETTKPNTGASDTYVYGRYTPDTGIKEDADGGDADEEEGGNSLWNVGLGRDGSKKKKKKAEVKKEKEKGGNTPPLQPEVPSSLSMLKEAMGQRDKFNTESMKRLDEELASYRKSRRDLINNQPKIPEDKSWLGQNKSWLMPLMGLGGMVAANALGGGNAAAGFGQGWQGGMKSGQDRKDAQDKQKLARMDKQQALQLNQLDGEHKDIISRLNTAMGLNKPVDDAYKIASIQQRVEAARAKATQGLIGDDALPLIHGLVDTPSKSKQVNQVMKLKFIEGLQKGTIDEGTKYSDWLADAGANYGGLFGESTIAGAAGIN